MDGIKFKQAFQNTKDYLSIAAKNPKMIWQDTKRMLHTTSIEVLAGATLTAMVAIPVMHRFEYARDGNIPLSFSEKSQIENDARYAGRQVEPWTAYLTSVNDLAMKVFECNNRSHKSFGNQSEIFASELDKKMDPKLRIHKYELFSLLPLLPMQAQAAKDAINDFIIVSNQLGPVNNHFDQAWDDSHIDHYRTEHYTETETYTDSKGNSHTRTVHKTRQVYDHTTHSYDYDRQHGELASQTLDALLSDIVTLKFKENITTASQTNADGEYVAEKTREGKENGKRLSKAELLNIASTWAKGSTLLQNLPNIYSLWGQLPNDANSWRSAKNTSHSTSYNTGSSYDSGPKEFQVAEHTLSHGRELQGSINEIVAGADYVQSMMPVLEQKIKDYIAIELNHQEGDSKKLKKEIMDITKKAYKSNIKAGDDIDGYRLYVVALAGLIGAISGGLVGLGIDKTADKFGIWEEKSHTFENLRYKN